MFHKPAQLLSNISPCDRPTLIQNELQHLGDVARPLSDRPGFSFSAGPSWVREKVRLNKVSLIYSYASPSILMLIFVPLLFVMELIFLLQEVLCVS